MISISLLVLAACQGPTELVLEVDRSTISAGGNDFATIKATARVWGDPVEKGTLIYFETDTGTGAAGGTFNRSGGPTDTTHAADAGGQATVKFYSGSSQGSATVKAYFTEDASSEYAESSITVTFGAPSGAQTPVDGTFRLSCEAVNIGALRVPMPNIQVTCTLTAQNQKGETLPAAALSPTFLTEAGSLTAVDDAYTGKRKYIYTPKGGSSSPEDVKPLGTLGETSYFDKNGRERNPRDGLVTLVAVTGGQEAFTDVNGNGQYDQGEPFVDTAEPFVDANDNDQKDAPERYQDANGNGKWDKANGKWDASTKIMAIYKILWTGALDSSSKTSRLQSSGSDFTIQDGGKVDIKAHVLDANMNPVAAFQDNTDYIEWVLAGGSSDALTNDSTEVYLKNALGFSFDTAANTERGRWKIVSNSFAPPTYTLTVEDGYPQDGTTSPYNYSVSLNTYTTPGYDADGYALSQVTEKIADKAEGTCD